MELEHSFSVPVPEDRAWDVLLDVERVAPCMPGATLLSIEGDTIQASIKVKVGPINMVYKGTARFTEIDRAAHVMTLEASGKETRGAGTASARVRSMLEGKGDETHVIVHTTLSVTGKPAQFGRGVMTEVGSKLIGIFADNLAAMIVAQPAVASATNNSDGNVPASSDTESDEALPIDVLNLSSRAWSSLRQDGIQTIGDLTRRTEQQLRALDNIGPASLTDIRSKLADRGLALADSAAEGKASAAGKHAAAAGGAAGGEDLAQVTPLRPARHESQEEDSGQAVPAPRAAAEPDEVETGWQPPDNEALDLLEVAGFPVLKRALPAAAALIAVILVLLGARRRRARGS